MKNLPPVHDRHVGAFIKLGVERLAISDGWDMVYCRRCGWWLPAAAGKEPDHPVAQCVAMQLSDDH